MKKINIVITLAAILIVGGGAIVFAHYKKVPAIAVQPVAVQQPVVQSQPIVAVDPTVQSTVGTPVVAKTTKQKVVAVQSTTTVTAPPAVQPTPQPVVATPSSAPVAPTPAPQPTSMYNVLSFSSSTDHKQSPTFTMKGTTWRIDYTCSATDYTNPYSFFNGYLKSTDGSIDKNFIDSVTDCPTDNGGSHSMTLTNQIPGTYYLDIGFNDNITYDFTVYDIH